MACAASATGCRRAPRHRAGLPRGRRGEPLLRPIDRPQGDGLRHLGFLGGRAPAVDGLAPTQFAAEPDQVIELAVVALAGERNGRSAPSRARCVGSAIT